MHNASTLVRLSGGGQPCCDRERNSGPSQKDEQGCPRQRVGATSQWTGRGCAGPLGRSGGSPSIRNAGGLEKSAAGADLSVGAPNWLNGWPPVTSVRGTQGIFHFSGWWGPRGAPAKLNVCFSQTQLSWCPGTSGPLGWDVLAAQLQRLAVKGRRGSGPVPPRRRCPTRALSACCRRHTRRTGGSNAGSSATKAARVDLPSADVDVCVSVFLVSTAVFAGGVDFCSWAEGAEGHELVTTSSAIPLCTWVRTIGSAYCPVFVEQTVDALTKKKLVTRWNTLCTREAKAVCASSAACCVLQTSSFVGAV